MWLNTECVALQVRTIYTRIFRNSPRPLFTACVYCWNELVPLFRKRFSRPAIVPQRESIWVSGHDLQPAGWKWNISQWFFFILLGFLPLAHTNTGPHILKVKEKKSGVFCAFCSCRTWNRKKWRSKSQNSSAILQGLQEAKIILTVGIVIKCIKRVYTLLSKNPVFGIYCTVKVEL